MTETAASTHAIWQQRLEELIPQVLTWFGQPDLFLGMEEGSLLEADTQFMATGLLSPHPGALLSSAFDSLRTCVDVLTRAGGYQGTATGISPLTRTALMGATQAFWLLAPTSATARQERYLRLALEENYNESRWVDHALSAAAEPWTHKETQEYVAYRRVLLAGVKRHAEALLVELGVLDEGDNARRRKGKVKVAVTETVTELTNAIGKDHPELQFLLMQEWFTASGYNHALAWQLNWSPGAEVSLLQGVVPIASRPEPSLEGVASPFELAVIATQIAVNRYRELAEMPVST